MNPYLYTLAKDVLLHETNGISKVRFAKILYFIHKELIRVGEVASDELSFIRMPLGPVPYGFMDLGLSKHIDVLIADKAALSYNTQIYKLKKAEKVKPSEYYPVVERVLNALHAFNTSQLVEISHLDPSWVKAKNGDDYYITKEDLSNNLPKNNAPKLSKELDAQRLQASLVSGMIDDIVEESTSLEYPQK